MTVLVTGDCIAIGYAGAMRPRVEVVARVGASSGAIAAWRRPAGPVNVLVISAGSNDPTSPRLAGNLRRIRASVRAAKVVWLLPRHRGAAATVRSVAMSIDECVDLRRLGTHDGVHPDSYRALVRLAPEPCRPR